MPGDVPKYRPVDPFNESKGFLSPEEEATKCCQPIPAAREAAAVQALRALTEDDPAYNSHHEPEDERPGDACLLCDLDNLSLAAAALLAAIRYWPNDEHSDTCSLARAIGKRAVYPPCDCGFEARAVGESA